MAFYFPLPASQMGDLLRFIKLNFTVHEFILIKLALGDIMDYNQPACNLIFVVDQRNNIHFIESSFPFVRDIAEIHLSSCEHISNGCAFFSAFIVRKNFEKIFTYYLFFTKSILDLQCFIPCSDLKVFIESEDPING